MLCYENARMSIEDICKQKVIYQNKETEINDMCGCVLQNGDSGDEEETEIEEVYVGDTEEVYVGDTVRVASGAVALDSEHTL